ncbi:MAG: (d)CMP kinase [Selenomonadaceae bacterium]|nr:(d)CMP kinase [Selenomonadaceae bacterium]MBR1581230.1 (d)CMP kinase [Selenomonadaceae bacterium]
MSELKVVAVDGPAGAGKSTISKLVAGRLGYTYIDTGAMYRAVALKVLESKLPLEDEEIMIAARDVDIDLRNEDGVNKTYLDGRDVSTEIRTLEVSRSVSKVAAVGFVRERLTELQRSMAKRGGVIMDGRDIGTVVLPDADVKIFLTASVAERARRRYDELKAKGLDVELGSIERDIAARDKLDSEREIAPLKQADDAILIDSTSMTIEEVADKMIELINRG